MSAPNEVYVLLKAGADTIPLVAHTTLQGAAMEMVAYTAEEQKQMWVASVRVVDDHSD